MITPQLIADALGIPAHLAERHCAPMRDALQLAEIDSPLRLAHWLAQVGHETGRLRYLRELWGPTSAQIRYERDPAAPWPTTRAQAARPEYRRNRLAWMLGNARQGDGRRYMGRGAIQCTGRANHRVLTQRLRALIGEACPDFEAAPGLLEAPEWAWLSAADYWRASGLNRWSDADDILGLTRRVNGGTNGLADRQALCISARLAIRHHGAAP